jgi:hypothetical protein
LEVRSNKTVEVLSSVDQGNLTNHRFDARVDAGNIQDVAATVRTSPDADLVQIHIGPTLSISNSILDIADLDTGNDLVARRAGRRITGAEATVVEDEAADGELAGEVLGKGIQVHFFEGRPAVGHDETW